MDLYIIGIDQRFDIEMVTGFIEEYNTHYPTVSGSQGGGDGVFTDYSIPYTPSLILIAPDHSIVEQAISMPTVAQDLIDFLETYNFSISGIEDELSATSLDYSFFPNPVENTIHIQTLESNRIEQIKIFQITGQEVFSSDNARVSNENSYDVSFLNHGIYLLSVEFENGKRVSKTFIKK